MGGQDTTWRTQKRWLTKRVKIDEKWKIKQPFYNRSGSLSENFRSSNDQMKRDM